MTAFPTRTLPAPLAGPIVLDLDMPHGSVFIQVTPSAARAEITLSADSGSRDIARAIADADMTVELRRMAVTVPATAPGATTVIGTQWNITGANVIVNRGSMWIDGNHVVVGNLSAGNAGSGIQAVATLPPGSAVRVRTRTASMTTDGRLEWVAYRSVSGSLEVAACVGELAVDTTSGSIHAAATGSARVQTVSGDIYLAECAGTAALRSTSGDIRVHATGPGTIQAESMSGDVTVTARPGLPLAVAETGLFVNARSMSGQVRTPLSSPRGGGW
ncbi:hypothetical protein Aple_050990 [Acrocarpospora pleiomorpha]|uniref:DUF4097 domain-containing protein n=1 Tax=Acrocarpospora pleiomorpha TaxID=90975 RepID=A0A5M3XMS3_9ACTN|nr:DUF4097 family beta strand repeat-containing protein [Acrocarpospora pleiomorpha]GES22202.1 hypothetical protein Aple_050990 [Acrocarpospora pleiomorpha]